MPLATARMNLHIVSPASAVVVAPGDSVTLPFHARTADGPAAGLSIAVSASGDAIRVPGRTLHTAADGLACLEVHGQAKGRAAITARAGKEKCQVAVFVTDVDVRLPHDLSLSKTDEDLLRILFWDKREVQVIRPFGGGLSGNRVLQVRAFDERGGFLTQVVKIGIRDEIEREGENYGLFQGRVAQAAPIGGVATIGVTAAIIYGDASAAAALEPVRPLADLFVHKPLSAIHGALFALLGRGLRNVHRQFEVRNLSPRDLVGVWYPENLVVSLNGGEAGYGVFAAGEVRNLPAAATELSPRDVERSGGNHDGLKVGDVLALRGFRIGKVQSEDLNLEDEGARKYRVKVRFDGAMVKGLAVGDKVDVVACAVTDRNARLRFAVEHCLKSHGLAKGRYGYHLGAEAYPDPLELMVEALERRWEFAWAAIHGDLHWENVMAESPQNWWLIDYGLTRDGAVLFDFVKLELYLRTTILAEDPTTTPAEILDFEQELAGNPFGHLPVRHRENEAQRKAMAAIQTIRRLAVPYMVDGFASYVSLLFAYSLAYMKYYPGRDQWEKAGQDSRRLEESARRSFWGMAVALNLARVMVSDRLSGKDPKLNCRFVPMGSHLEPQAGCIALDVGNRLTQGIIDHHHLRDGATDSTAALVWKHSDLVTGHEGVEDPDKITWVLHEDPDFDGIAALYLAWHRLKCGYFPPGTDQLQRYAATVDQGKEFLERVAFPERTPYGLFMGHLARVHLLKRSGEADLQRVKLGFEVMRYVCRLEAEGIHAMANHCCPLENEFYGSEIEDDEDKFWMLDRRNAAAECSVSILVDGHLRPLRLLAVQNPQALLFIVWARRNGYPLTVVRSPQPEKPDDMVIVSVPPAFTNALKGLGAALDVAETAKRAELPGRERPVEHKRPGFDNSDPWYDGRSPVHAYTIVAAPHAGTVLTMAEVLEIVKSGAWHEA